MSIADDIAVGLQCSHCGICFEQAHGVPVLCDDCYEEEEDEGEGLGLPRAWHEEL